MMSAPPPRPPPPTSPLKQTTLPAKETGDGNAPVSRPHSTEIGSNMDSTQNKQVTAAERERSKTFSGHTHNRSIPSEPRQPPQVLPRPRSMSRSSSSPPPLPLPTLTEGEGGGGGGGGGRGRGRERVTESGANRVPPSRPPPPARARSLPRGGSLRTWEQGNRDKIGSHNQSKSYEHIHKTDVGLKSPVHTTGLSTVPNGDTKDSSGKSHGNRQETNGEGGPPGSQSNGEDKTTASDPSPTSPSVASGNETTPSQPVVPRRPYRPPRPFPPSTNGSPSRSAASARHKNRGHKSHHGDPRHKPPTRSTTEYLTRSVVVSKSTNQEEEEEESRDTPPTDHMTSNDTPAADHMTSHEDGGSGQPPEAGVESEGTVTGEGESDGTATGEGESTGNVTGDGGEGESDGTATGEGDSTGNVTGDGGEGESAQDSSSQHDATAKPSCHRTGRKGPRLFNSVRKGLSKMKHRNVRSGSLPTITRPPPRVAKIASEAALAEVEEEDEEMYPDPLPQGIVDPLVILCVAYLNRDSVLREAGLFRIPGNVSSVKKLRTDYIRGQPIDLMQVLDPHTVAGLLKYHFREWRMSIIPRGKPLAEVTAAVKDKDEERVRQVLLSLPKDSLATLRIVTELLSKVVEYSESNLMTSGTLATSCGQSFFPYLPPSPANSLLKFMVDHCTTLFPE